MSNLVCVCVCAHAHMCVDQRTSFGANNWTEAPRNLSASSFPVWDDKDKGFCMTSEDSGSYVPATSTY